MQDPFGHEAKKVIGDKTKHNDKTGNFQAFKIPKKPKLPLIH